MGLLYFKVRDRRRCTFPGALPALPRTLALCGVKRRGGPGLHGLGFQCHALEHTGKSLERDCRRAGHCEQRERAPPCNPTRARHGQSTWRRGRHRPPLRSSAHPQQAFPSPSAPGTARMETRGALLSSVGASHGHSLLGAVAAGLDRRFTGSTNVKPIRPFSFGSLSGACSVMTKWVPETHMVSRSARGRGANEAVHLDLPLAWPLDRVPGVRPHPRRHLRGRAGAKG